jgi:hypothetical protein
MKRRLALVVTICAAVLLPLFAPLVYSPTTVYAPLHLTSYPTYPNWESPSCSAFGHGFYYGRTVFQHKDSYQFGCPSPIASLP